MTSGFTVLFDDAPDPEDVAETGGIPRSGGVPRLPERRSPGPPGSPIAREYGVADLDDNGEWVVGDLSRLDPV